jgi:hypothetical protein
MRSTVHSAMHNTMRKFALKIRCFMCPILTNIYQ